MAAWGYRFSDYDMSGERNNSLECARGLCSKGIQRLLCECWWGDSSQIRPWGNFNCSWKSKPVPEGKGCREIRLVLFSEVHGHKKLVFQCWSKPHFAWRGIPWGWCFGLLVEIFHCFSSLISIASHSIVKNLFAANTDTTAKFATGHLLPFFCWTFSEEEKSRLLDPLMSS